MWKLKQNLKAAYILVLLIHCSACSEPPPQPFNSEKWKAGSKPVRGSMVQDLQNRRLLKGKSKSEVEQLLGKPDTEYGERGWGYQVVTISRCYFWVCRMEVGFNQETGKATGEIAVSD